MAAEDQARIPPLVALPKLLSAANHIAQESETAEELQLLLAPGSSLGGARPKASVIGNNEALLIAKFPHKDDDIDVVRWEAVALKLASLAGVDIPKWHLADVGGKKVLLLERFDRTGAKFKVRVPYLSAMSMLDARDNETHSYLEIADAVKRFGSRLRADLRELFSRMVFNILISNTDDHLRNHGFLCQNFDGWKLSPAFDLNPVPIDVRPRVLTTTITEHDGTASLELALQVAPYFELNKSETKRVVHKVGKAVSKWHYVAEAIGMSKASLERMASAFEHDDLRQALRKNLTTS